MLLVETGCASAVNNDERIVGAKVFSLDVKVGGGLEPALASSALGC